MKRLFTAIKVHPSEEFLKIYFRLIKSLQADKIKWVDKDNIHITLKFFGETSEDKVDEISQALDDAVYGFSPFDLKLSDVGIFGSSYKPRVIWFGIEKSDTLQELAKSIFRELKEIGIEPDRQNFVPHLTIGRIKYIENKKYFQEVIDKNKKGYIQSIPVEEIILFESILHRTGPEYVVVDKFKLQ
jgi:2'-5' RNA ligase